MKRKPDKAADRAFKQPAIDYVVCEACQKSMPLLTGYWVINGLGELLCYGNESCFAQRAYRHQRSEAGSA